MSEKYKPSQEEIEKAGEMMTKKEQIMSELRGSDLNELSKKLKDGLNKGRYHLELGGHNGFMDPEGGAHYPLRYPENAETDLYGEIDNHRIDILVRADRDMDRRGKGKISGSIDGKEIGDDISEEIAAEIFSKYFSMARLQGREYEKMADAEI